MSASKWIFGTLGFVLFGPLGAILGATAGAILEEMYHKAEPARATHERATHERATAGDVRISLLVLIACVIKADGRILKSEVNFIKPYLIKAYGEQNAVEALQMLKKLLEQDIDPIPSAQQMSQHINYSVRLEMVHLLLKLAYSDNEVDPREEETIRRISTAMGISDNDYQSLAALYQKSQNPNWAYTALEITPDASTDEIKKAYRRMAMKYHPDKVAGAGEEIQKAATEKFRSINEAYEHIKKTRGIV